MEGCWALAPASTVIATSLSIMATATTHWTHTQYRYTGLWKGCFAFGKIWQCRDSVWQNAGSWIPAVKVLLLISISLAAFFIIFSLIAFLKESYRWIRLTIGIIVLQVLCLSAGLFTFLGYFCKFIRDNEGNQQELAWSYYFGWVSVGFYVIALLLFTRIKRVLRVRGVYENIN